MPCYSPDGRWIYFSGVQVHYWTPARSDRADLDSAATEKAFPSDASAILKETLKLPGRSCAARRPSSW